jgi:hypothetical protein
MTGKGKALFLQEIVSWIRFTAGHIFPVREIEGEYKSISEV